MCVTRYNTINTMAKTGVINARVEQAVRDRLETYCHENNVKMAVIIEKALSQWLDANAHTSTQSDEGAIKALETKMEKIEKLVSEKIDQHQLDERLAMATMPIWEHLENTPSEIASEQTETSDQDDSPSSPPSLAEGLNQKQLAVRLDVSVVSIINWHKSGKLPEKTAERDPDGRSWEKRQGRYFPCKAPFAGE